MKLYIDSKLSPTTWIKQFLANAQNDIIVYYMIGANLERQFEKIVFSYDTDTRCFDVGSLVYRITTVPDHNTILSCIKNLGIGILPVLLVPKSQEIKAWKLAQNEGVDQEISIISIEDFVAMNIIELAIEENADFFSILQEIVQIYNRRLAEVETDLSLQIEVR